MQKQLVVPSQRGVHFAVFIEVRGDGPGAVVEIQEQDHAFANVHEEADLAAASMGVSKRVKGGGG